MPSSASMATALSRLAISRLLALVDGCSAAETSAIASIDGFSRGIAIARGQDTEAEVGTQRAKPAWSCACNDLFGHREIPECSGSPSRTCRPGTTFSCPGGACPGLNRPCTVAGGRPLVVQPRLILRVDGPEAAVWSTRWRVCVAS